MTRRISVKLALIALLSLAGVAHAGPEVILTVPVKIKNIHPDARTARVECHVGSKPLKNVLGTMLFDLQGSIGRARKDVPITNRGLDANVEVGVTLNAGNSVTAAKTFMCYTHILAAEWDAATTTTYSDRTGGHRVIAWPINGVQGNLPTPTPKLRTSAPLPSRTTR
jgi:hypothetical protein